MDLEASSCSTSEIVESNNKYESKLNLKLKSDEMDELDQLLKAIDARISSRQAGPNPLTRSNSPKLSASETVNIKQALRRLCISNASEMAATKRVGKIPNGSGTEPVPGTIRRLYASLVVRSDESDERTNLVAQERENDKKGKNISTNCIGCIKNKIEPEPSSDRTTSSITTEIESSSSKSDSDPEISKPEPEPEPPAQQPETEINSPKSSIGEYYTSSSQSISNSASSRTGTGFGTVTRPHMSKDSKWLAIQSASSRIGNTGTATLTLDSFKLIKRLGCGDIGTVYLAELTGTEPDTDCLFALKVMDIEFLTSRKKLIRAETEREILGMLDHPFLPSLYGSFVTDNLACLVMEFCPGGDLHVLRQKQPARCFNEQAARFYVAEVLLALEYLHMLGIIYRDLKPENILVRSDGHIMLSDFDLSMRCSVNPTLLPSSKTLKRFQNPKPCPDPFCLPPTSCFVSSTNSTTKPQKLKINTGIQLVAEPTEARSNSFVGTHEYLAPEIIKGDGHGSAVDWWTLGVFLYELLYGKTPFKGADNDETLGNVVCNDLKFPDEPSVSSSAKDLIRRLLVKEPEKRLGFVRGAADLKRHSFFEGLNWALVRSLSPPETDGSFYVGTNLGTRKKKEAATCLNFIGHGEESEFGVF
ncbi:hypothetical protein LUZ60_007421 [Juncus effusus]|nr:hypothetical protein LUZ60_007421 [Juncus effusus]